MNILAKGALAALAIGAVAAPAVAADLPSRKAPLDAPIYDAPSPWMVRVRGLAVIPADGAKLFANGTYLPNQKADVSNSVVPELDITYFFTKNIAAELILGVTPHNATAKGAPVVSKIGSTTLLPPTLTLQYHFDNFGAFKPYVGAGVNYTFFLDEKEKGVFTTFNLRNTFGAALQVGFDYMIDRHWGINVDVKKLYLRPQVSAFTPALGGNLVTGTVKLDPWIIGTGVTYRF